MLREFQKRFYFLTRQSLDVENVKKISQEETIYDGEDEDTVSSIQNEGIEKL